MHLDVGLGGDAFGHDEGSHLLTLVALELDNLSELLVVNNGTVACEFLLEGLQQLLLVILCEVAWRSGEKRRARQTWRERCKSNQIAIQSEERVKSVCIPRWQRCATSCRCECAMHTFGKSLKSGKRLTTVPLLDTDMDVVLGLLLLGSLGGSVWL